MLESGGSASSKYDLAQRLTHRGSIKTRRVFDVMIAVDRANYAPAYPYVDRPLSVGCGATISAPHMHAQALELLAGHLQPGARGLDVGCGSGYLSACMARLVGPAGRVVGIDIIEELVRLSRANVAKRDRDLLDTGCLSFLQGDGWGGHALLGGPFNAIHVGAAADKVPQVLLGLLASSGRMVIPVGPVMGPQVLLQIDRLPDGQYLYTNLMQVSFVPLLHA
mmetsp:Transcript_7410/g.13193  ORF Transcript_7410/g.13193 Transcript_7410/m.13193 type:complete len:222 (-) Transcript_7410:12-677(-)